MKPSPNPSRTQLSAHDGIDLIGARRHERFIVACDKFNIRVAEKAKAAAAPTG